MRVFNFNAGPAALPLPVLEEAQRELVDFQGTGMSIMEHSHRGAAYDRVHNEALSLMRELLAVPESHDILFLQGGASTQFAMVPLNFLRPGASADYVVTGGWGRKAFEEAERVGKARLAYDGLDAGAYRSIPERVDYDDRAAYVHITSNNTLEGTQYHAFPETRAPLVADMCSDLLWRPIDVSRFALIYAGAQKNIGPSGISVVIVAKDFLAQARTDLPNVLRYAIFAKENSLYNTPPTFAVYLTRGVLAWTKHEGGLVAIEKRNREKAALVYAAMDAAPALFSSPVEKTSRSIMTVVFRLPTAELEKEFLVGAEAAGMVGLKGHRSTGGVRASLYNAVPLAAAEALAQYMTEFAGKRG
jgi:phosphoserine aminotransferase